MFTHTKSTGGHRVFPSYVPGPEQMLGDTDEPSSLDSCLPGDYDLERDESYFQKV